jgi:hypothetical protein
MRAIEYRDGSRNLTLGVQIPTYTIHKGEKLQMAHAFKPIKLQIGHCSDIISIRLINMKK